MIGVDIVDVQTGRRLTAGRAAAESVDAFEAAAIDAADEDDDDVAPPLVVVWRRTRAMLSQV